MTLISLKNLDVTIGKKQILKNIDLEVELLIYFKSPVKVYYGFLIQKLILQNCLRMLFER